MRSHYGEFSSHSIFAVYPISYLLEALKLSLLNVPE
jgi:hypothetical protein